MKRRILVIVPLYITKADAENIKTNLGKYSWKGTEIDVVGLRGNVAVNSRSEADMAAPEFLDLVTKAEKDKYDAVISYCYADVGVDAAKEKAEIHVIGPLETSAIVANMLGSRFSMVTIETAMAYMQPRLRALGLDKNYVSTRGIDLEKYFVFSADAKHSKITRDALLEESMRAVSDGANVVILACTGFPISKDMRENLRAPMVESTITLKVAEVLTDLKHTYTESGVAENAILNKEENANKVRIKLLVPTSMPGMAAFEGIKKITNPGTSLSISMFKDGSKSIESAYDVVRVSPFIVRESAKAVREGFNAVVLSSFEDPLSLLPAKYATFLFSALAKHQCCWPASLEVFLSSLKTRTNMN